MPEISEAWLALIGALFGGVGLKIIDHWLSRAKYKEDLGAKFRDELRVDMKTLREDLERERQSGESWRSKYYETMQAMYVHKEEHVQALARIGALEDQVRDWKFKYYQLWEDMAVERDAKGQPHPPLPTPGSMEEVDSDGPVL